MLNLSSIFILLFSLGWSILEQWVVSLPAVSLAGGLGFPDD